VSRNPIPWTERLSPWRAPIDVALGRYPFFAFGGPLNPKILPVFHFHEVSPEYLEPHLLYLKDNGYRCAGAEEFLGIVERGEPIMPRTVFLTFDDAWASLWTVAAPLLRKHGMRAVTFAIPGRVSPSEGVRKTIEEDSEMLEFGDRGEEPFCRWEELKRLDKEGVVEVESHTYAHEQIPVAGPSLGMWAETQCSEMPILSRPLVRKGEESFRPFDEREIGVPLLPTRSRMSDALRANECGEVTETDQEQREAIRGDLILCRETLEKRLERPIRILCFPWAVAGGVAREEAKVLGYRAAFSDSFPGKRFVHSKADPFQLMRLKHNWIYYLPGKGRKNIVGTRIH